MNDTCYLGDVRDGLRAFIAAGIRAQTCVTSPPYWGLRDYGVDGQLGLEATPQEYVERMVEVFRLVRDVLADDGTLWLNLGDSYCASPAGNVTPSGISQTQGKRVHTSLATYNTQPKEWGGLKPKDLVGIPWRVAFALQADGWVLRSEIIWAKPNPMPESVTDRPTKSHEQLFLFSKAKWIGPPRGQFAHIADEDARWLAGMIDTEGCIVIKRCQHEGRADTFAPQVTFGSTSRALIDRVAAIARHGNVLERKGLNAPMFYWQLAHGVARDFLYRIYPFLIVKQRQARIGIHVDSLTYYRGGQKAERKQRTPSEHSVLVSMWERNKQCNKFGAPDLSDVPDPVYGRWDSERYFYDADAVKEPATGTANPRVAEWASGPGSHSTIEHTRTVGVGSKLRAPKGAPNAPRPKFNESFDAAVTLPVENRNKRTVWTIPTEAFADAHFATFPTALVEPCILAGSRVGDVVLDPFMGSGTVAQVAQSLGRRWIGCELNPAYHALIAKRSAQLGMELVA